jgi:molybdopterin-guanine dinucleotide biosynthesis protein A
MKQTIPAIIFAGGKSSRMGRDKALLPFGDAGSLAAYQYHRLHQYFEHVYLSAKENKFDFNAPLITDSYDIHSPLVGIVSAFEALDTPMLFILSVDAPFVDKTVIDTLIDAWKGEDAVIARSSGEVQPLCGLYSRSILPLAKGEMEKGNHKLKLLLESADTHYVDFEKSHLFLNLNHPHEYEEAKKLISC